MRRISSISFLALLVFCISGGNVYASIEAVAFQMGGGWMFSVPRSGTGALSYGASTEDSVFIPEGYINFEEFVSASIEAAESFPEKPKSSPPRVEFRILLLERGQTTMTSRGAYFTPRLKQFVDQALNLELSERVRYVTNQYPVFSEISMHTLIDWSNSPLSRAPRESSVLGDSPKGQAPPAVASPVARALAENQPASKEAVPVAPVGEAEESSFGIRGWLVVGLLAIAAFLAYRFIKLRSGA